MPNTLPYKMPNNQFNPDDYRPWLFDPGTLQGWISQTDKNDPVSIGNLLAAANASNAQDSQNILSALFGGVENIPGGNFLAQIEQNRAAAAQKSSNDIRLAIGNNGIGPAALTAGAIFA